MKKFAQSANISTDGVVDSVIGSVQDVKGATVNLANSLNGLTGPGIGQSFAGQFANNVTASLLGKISGGIGGFLSSSFGGGFGAKNGGTGKLPNPLEQFASFNYIFTLGCLTERELSFPDQTYRRRDPEIVILRSGGGPTPRIVLHCTKLTEKLNIISTMLILKQLFLGLLDHVLLMLQV